jgi:thiol:disulfide interchange protein DsbC
MSFRRAVRFFVLASTIAPVVAFGATQAPKDAPATIQHALESRFGISVIDVKPAPLPGLYEVFTGDTIVYTDSTGDHMLAGPLVDTVSRRDLTAERMSERNTIDFDSLPFDRAIKTVKGNGQRKLAVFADPDCPFCRKLEGELQNVTNVTLYTFLLPISELHADAVARSHAIWCSSDPSKAWTQWLLERKAPDNGAACKADPVEELQALARTLHISGTPTMFLENGHRVAGAMSAAELNALLVSASAAAASQRDTGQATP